MKPTMMIIVYHYAILFTMAAISGFVVFVFKTDPNVTPPEINYTWPIVLMFVGLMTMMTVKKFTFPDLDKPADESELNAALRKSVAVFIPCAEIPYIGGFMVYATHKNLDEYWLFVAAALVVYLFGAWNLNQLKAAMQRLPASRLL